MDRRARLPKQPGRDRSRSFCGRASFKLDGGVTRVVPTRRRPLVVVPVETMDG